MKTTVLFLFVSLQVFAQSFERKPYLMNPREDGITVLWSSIDPVLGEILISSDDHTFSEKFSEAKVGNKHEVIIKGLKANTKYSYCILKSGVCEAIVDNQFFFTNPVKATAPIINFWAMGDFGAANTPNYKINQEEVKNAFLKYPKDRTNLWLWLGDNAYCCGTETEYQTQVFDFYGQNILGNIPILPSPGNHEYLFSNTARTDHVMPYFDLTNVPKDGEAGGIASKHKEYYSLDYGNAHFVSLDSYGYGEDGKLLADPTSIQYRWLETDLIANKKQWTIIFFHHPIYTKRSHDSDFEPELVNLRRALVPMFDLYNVDFILNGHSHIYERSNLIKNQFETSDFFDPRKHVVQATKGFYNPSSKPYINKEKGTIYMTIGSAGRLDWNTLPQEHPTSVYSNYQIGGSSLFTINQNKLESRWIAANGVVLDSFTVFKDVNKTKDITVNEGDSVSLTASWPGAYKWSSATTKERTLKIEASKTERIIVRDEFGYLADTFNLKVNPLPIISCSQNTQIICKGDSININVTIQHLTSLPSNTQIILLKDLGLNSTGIILGEAKLGMNKFFLKNEIEDDPTYYVVASNENFEAKFFPSSRFRIAEKAQAEIINAATIPFVDVVDINVQVSGTFPIVLKISTLPEQSLSQKTNSFKGLTNESKVFKIEKISNTCGVGKINGGDLIIESLLSNFNKKELIQLYPNPASQIIYLTQNGQALENASIRITNLLGLEILKIEMLEANFISTKNMSAGVYILEFKDKNNSWTSRFVIE